MENYDEQRPSDDCRAPIERLAKAMISRALTDGATGLCLLPGGKWLRVAELIDGRWEVRHNVPAKLKEPLIQRFKVMAGMDVEKIDVDQIGRIEIELKRRKYILSGELTAGGGGETLQFRITPQA
jgi:type II secretory ATPase GspE/PulE/Tfp pilus assembly ATPase PilB-like protein